MDNQDEPVECRHHWQLGAPQDGRIIGRCRRCDAIRMYPAIGIEWEVPAERGEEVHLPGDDRFRRDATEAMRWSA